MQKTIFSIFIFLSITAFFINSSEKENKGSIKKPINSPGLFRIEQEKSSDEDFDALRDNYKSLKNAGGALLVPGVIISAISLIFGTPPIVIAIRTYYSDSYTVDSNPSLSNTYFLALSFYIGCLSTGILLDIAAIICYIFAGKAYKKLQQQSNISFYLGSNDSQPCLGVRMKL